MEEIEIFLEKEISEAKIELINEGSVIYPLLEKLTVIPSGEKQEFTHPNSYGYDKVVVEAVTSEELNITPSKEEQVKEGMFNKVTVAGDSNLLAENIKSGANIFGVEGTAPVVDFQINDCRYLFHYGCRWNIVDKLVPLCKNVVSIANMFSHNTYITDLDLSVLDVNETTEFFNAFQACTELQHLNIKGWDFSKATSVTYFCQNCKALTNLEADNINCSKATSIAYMFAGCTSLTTLPEIDCSSCTTLNEPFQSDTSLENFGGLKDIGKAYLTSRSKNYSSYKIDLSYCVNLTHDSLMNVINKLYDIATKGCKTQSLVLGETNLAKLTEEEIAIATEHGWSVS